MLKSGSSLISFLFSFFFSFTPLCSWAYINPKPFSARLKGHKYKDAGLFWDSGVDECLCKPKRMLIAAYVHDLKYLPSEWVSRKYVYLDFIWKCLKFQEPKQFTLGHGLQEVVPEFRLSIKMGHPFPATTPGQADLLSWVAAMASHQTSQPTLILLYRPLTQLPGWWLTAYDTYLILTLHSSKPFTQLFWSCGIQKGFQKARVSYKPWKPGRQLLSPLVFHLALSA